MKKWYRIFEIVNGAPTLLYDSQWNWHENKKEANEETVNYYINKGGDDKNNLTVLPVFEKVN